MKTLSEFKQYILQRLDKFETVAETKKQKKEQQNKLTYFFTHLSDNPDYTKELKLASDLENIIPSFNDLNSLVGYLRTFVDDNFNRKIARTVASALVIGVELQNFNPAKGFVLPYLLEEIDLKIKQNNSYSTHQIPFQPKGAGLV